MFSRVARQAVRQATSRVQKQTGNYCYNATRAFSVQDFPEASSGAKQLKTSFELPDPDNGKKNYQLTKIVATIGPTSEQLEPLQKVVQAGMKIMRLNFSHATTDEVELRMENLALSQVSEQKYYWGFPVYILNFQMVLNRIDARLFVER